MTEDEAIQEAQKLLKQDATVETGQALSNLEPYISADKFGHLWEAFIASAPIDVVIAHSPLTLLPIFSSYLTHLFPTNPHVSLTPVPYTHPSHILFFSVFSFIIFSLPFLLLTV